MHQDVSSIECIIGGGVDAARESSESLRMTLTGRVASHDGPSELGIPDSADELGIPDSADELGIPDSADELGIPDSADELGIPDSADELGIPSQPMSSEYLHSR
ncbi:hypothetical protein BZA77DRAFT_293181 [Pyronema omphalodes]|nr:hypothetical protein BZA77DRAFT_293181 [Pyronema omphalodes]